MSTINSLTLILILLIAFLFALLMIEKIKRENLEEKISRMMSGHDKVKAKTYLLTSTEQRFFEELKKAFGENYLVFSQVSLSAIVEIKDDQLDKFERRNTISKFYVDFILCDKKSTKTLLVIELNDNTHNYSNRKERDLYIKGVLDSSQVPFYPCPVNTVSYQQDIEKIKNLLI